MVRCIPLLTGGLKVRILPGLQKWMNSSMAERVFVRHRVESSNLSSSSTCECGEDGDSQQTVNLLFKKLRWFESIHSHEGESPLGSRELSWKQLTVTGSGVRVPLSPQKYLESWQSGNVMACYAIIVNSVHPDVYRDTLRKCPAGRHGCMHSTANRKKEVRIFRRTR